MFVKFLSFTDKKKHYFYVYIVHLNNFSKYVRMHYHIFVKFIFYHELSSFFFFCLFSATLVAYGGSQARGQIGAVATVLHHSHSNTRSKPLLRPIPHSWYCWILSPLGKAQGLNLCPHRIQAGSFPLSHYGNSSSYFSRRDTSSYTDLSPAPGPSQGIWTKE